MKLAIASCLELPSWEKDDAVFHDALDSQGISYQVLPWEDETCPWEEFDACLIRTTWNYQNDLPRYLKWAEATSKKTRLLNPFSIVQWNSHKRYLDDLEKWGTPVLPTSWLARGETYEISDLIAGWDAERAFIKPAIGATARETLRFDTRAPADLDRAQQHLDRLLRQEDLMIQPYYQSVEKTGEISLLFFGGRFSHSVRKVPVPGDYRVQDDFGASDEPFHPEPEFIELGETILSYLPEQVLYARIDFLTADDGTRRVNELELIEPSLFFRHSKEAPNTFAKVIRDNLENARTQH